MKHVRQIIIIQCFITYEVDACEYACEAGGSEVGASEDVDGEACACEVGGVIL